MVDSSAQKDENTVEAGAIWLRFKLLLFLILLASFEISKI